MKKIIMIIAVFFVAVLILSVFSGLLGGFVDVSESEETESEDSITEENDVNGYTTFIIDGKRYGTDSSIVTWIDWCASEYNTDGFFITSDGMYVAKSYFEADCSGVVIATSNGTPVNKENSVINSFISNSYKLIALGSSSEESTEEEETTKPEGYATITIGEKEYGTDSSIVTWVDWCASEYNTDGFFITSDGAYVAKSYNEVEVTGIVIANTNGLAVFREDLVSNSSDYILIDILTEPKTVSFNVFIKSGDEYFTLSETVDKGTTWRDWCEEYNSNLSAEFLEYLGTVWSNDRGYVLYTNVGMECVGGYLYDINNNKVLWDSEIVSGDYGNRKVEFILMTFAGPGEYELESYTVYEGTTWGEWCAENSDRFINDAGLVWDKYYGCTYCLEGDLNFTNVRWDDVIVNGYYDQC